LRKTWNLEGFIVKRRLIGLIALLALLALALPGAAVAKDRDRDGLPDRWERRHDLSTKHKSSGGDPDRDRVDNRNEYRERTDPRDRDSDDDRKGDGLEDADRDRLRNAAEDATGNDPVDADTDNDGIPDGREHAGVIRSFEEGLLTIDLSNGDSLRGWVTDETRVKCKSEAEAEKEYRFKLKVHDATWDEGEDVPDEEWTEEEWSDEEWTEEEGLDEDVDKPKPDEDEGKYEADHCSAAWLDPGRRGRQAKLSLTSDGLVFEKIELLR
jgi:hypothetical protein